MAFGKKVVGPVFFLYPFSYCLDEAVALLKALEQRSVLIVLSMRKVIKMFDRTDFLFLIPKNIVKIGASRDILSRMMAYRLIFFSEYFHRNISESGFSAYKGRFGNVVSQRR
jgi:transposase